jgi:hypothetical protein
MAKIIVKYIEVCTLTNYFEGGGYIKKALLKSKAFLMLFDIILFS